MSDGSHLDALRAQVIQTEQNAADLREAAAAIDLQAAKQRLLAAELDAERASMALDQQRLRTP